jgi:hypothetical protein
MNHEQYVEVQRLTRRPQMVEVNDLMNLADRTLIYGYDCDRNTFHLYLKDNLFVRIYYTFEKKILSSDIGPFMIATECVPDKRVYPECCDFDFCVLLHSKGIDIPFTGFESNRPPSTFYGVTL